MREREKNKKGNEASDGGSGQKKTLIRNVGGGAKTSQR